MAALMAAAFASCTDDNEPDPVNEEELITTVKMTFTDNTGGVKVFSFTDLDGDGPDAPVIENDTLSANTNYAVTVVFLNESENPAEDITEEVKEEGEEHQVFYDIANTLNLSYTYNDADTKGRPIGLLNSFITGDVSSGALKVTLRHEPNKTASGVVGGDITNAGGETDIEVEFDVVIE